MKRIGIVTIVDNYNFGNRLQNYAVYHLLKREYGIKAITLATQNDAQWNRVEFIPEIKNNIVLALSHIPGIVEKRCSPRMNRWVNFINWSRRIPTKYYYNSYNLPEKIDKEYDCFFAGSDQIWNYTFSSDRFYNYFLQFADPEKRASISASFGIEEIPDEWKQRYTDGLSGMKYISVREGAGAKIVKELTGRTVPVLVDPVMMLDREEWLKTASTPRVDCSVPYVLKYYLGDDDNKEIDLWAEQNGYKVYELMKKDNPALYSAGPGEFLTLIDKAALVCSDSFHCVAFSILMKKPFIVYARKGKLNNMTSRMDTLLDKFGFQDRWDTSLQEENFLKCDFSELDGRLEAERQRFRKYIETVLNGENLTNPQLADKKACTGCTACASICPKHCIEMFPDQNGFHYPSIDNTACINCGACERVCPVLNGVTKNECASNAYAAYTNDELLRMDSSSGGLFSELAKTVIDRGGVVYGAVYDEHFKIFHRAVESMEELAALRGAKYAESHLGKTFPEIKTRLEKGQIVLFSGTPCQVGGLQAFLKKDYDNLLCVDFVCHGVPSPVAWKKYVEYRAQNDNNGVLPEAINLRDKSSGWSKYQYSNTFKYADGKTHSDMSTQSLYMHLFTNDYISRRSCENCRFKGYSRPSDITLGDFWGIWDIAPNMDDNRGTSLVLIHSEKGQKAWNEISRQITAKTLSLENASQKNKSLISSSALKKEREKVLETIRTEGIEKASELLQRPNSVLKRMKRKVRHFIG